MVSCETLLGNLQPLRGGQLLRASNVPLATLASKVDLALALLLTLLATVSLLLLVVVQPSQVSLQLVDVY